MLFFWKKFLKFFFGFEFFRYFNIVVLSIVLFLVIELGDCYKHKNDYKKNKDGNYKNKIEGSQSEGKSRYVKEQKKRSIR